MITKKELAKYKIAARPSSCLSIFQLPDSGCRSFSDPKVSDQQFWKTCKRSPFAVVQFDVHYADTLPTNSTSRFIRASFMTSG